MALNSFFKLIFHFAVIFAVFSGLLIFLTEPKTVEFQLVCVTLVTNCFIIIGILTFSWWLKRKKRNDSTN